MRIEKYRQRKKGKKERINNIKRRKMKKGEYKN